MSAPVETPKARPVAAPARMSEQRTAALAALLVAVGPVSLALYTPAMPELVADFDSTRAAVKTTLSAYFAGFAAAQLIAGPACDAFGRRKATVGFLLIYLIGSVVAAMAVSMEMLIVGRLIQGTGAAVGITVSRAIVRDQFVGEQASRIMNLVAIMLAVAPALSPAIGGLLLTVGTWQLIFVVMVLFALVSIAVAIFALKETIVPSPSYARPAMVVANYRKVVSNAEFLSASMTCGFAVGTVYSLATMLPFVMIERVGLSPTEFGFAMIMQSGAFFTGSLVARQLLSRKGAEAIVGPGLVLMIVGASLLVANVAFFGPSFFTVMAPVSFIAFGIAFIMPHMQVAGLMPFTHIAGSASAMMGFIQMGSGMVGGSVAALFSDPVTSLYVVVPGMVAISATSYLWHRRVRRRVILSERALKAQAAE